MKLLKPGDKRRGYSRNAVCKNCKAQWLVEQPDMYLMYDVEDDESVHYICTACETQQELYNVPWDMVKVLPSKAKWRKAKAQLVEEYYNK